MVKKDLGTVTTVTMGQSPSSETYNTEGIGLPFFQGKADFGTMTPSARVYCNQPKKTANADDILISVRAPVGATNIVYQKCCIGRGLAAISALPELTHNKYVLYYLRYFEKDIEAMGVGSTFKAISRNDLETIPIPLPCLDVQKQIAGVLDRVGSLIEMRKKQIDKLELLVKSRFVEMFGDPVTNPMGWEVKRLDQVADSRLGKMLDAKQQTGEDRYHYLANFNVQWFRIDLDKLNAMDFDEASRAEFALEYGDLLVCEGGEAGRTAIWKNEMKDCFFQKAIHRVRCKVDVCVPEYIAWTMYHKAKITNFDGLVTSATIAHLTGEKLKRLKVQIPPLDLQHRFADFVLATDKSKFALQRGLDKLEILYQSLMQKCFAGELFN